jgi:hypothetical protein
MLARLRSRDQLLLRQRHRVEKRLHGRLAVAPATLMRPLAVVLEKRVEIARQPVDLLVEAPAKRDAVKLVEQRLVEALADAVRLRALGRGARLAHLTPEA